MTRLFYLAVKIISRKKRRKRMINVSSKVHEISSRVLGIWNKSTYSKSFIMGLGVMALIPTVLFVFYAIFGLLACASTAMAAFVVILSLGFVFLLPFLILGIGTGALVSFCLYLFNK